MKIYAVCHAKPAGTGHRQPAFRAELTCTLNLTTESNRPIALFLRPRAVVSFAAAPNGRAADAGVGCRFDTEH